MILEPSHYIKHNFVHTLSHIRLESLSRKKFRFGAKDDFHLPKIESQMPRIPGAKMQIPFLSDLMVSRFQTKVSPEKTLSWSCKKCFNQASGKFMLRAKMSFIIIARTVLIGDTNEGQGQWPVSQSFEWFRIPIHDFEAYAEKTPATRNILEVSPSHSTGKTHAKIHHIAFFSLFTWRGTTGRVTTFHCVGISILQRWKPWGSKKTQKNHGPKLLYCII